MMNLSMKLALTILATAFLLIGYIIFFIFEFRLPGIHYILPDNYTGRVIIQFNDPTCRSFERVLRFYVVNISDEGQACSSDDRPMGVRIVKYSHLTSGGVIKDIDRKDIYGNSFDYVHRTLTFNVRW
jgi:hypothetical protein